MHWEWREGKDLTYLTIPKWEEAGVQIAFSSRLGGVSKAPFHSLNLGLHVGDDPQSVLENRRLWLEELQAGWSDVIVGQQVHGNQVAWVGEQAAGCGVRDLKTAVPGLDGLATKSNIALMAFFADCVPVFFYHPVIKAVGLAHAGWRGTTGKVSLGMLERFAEAGGRPEECWVALGPSIGPCCYEVDEKVAGIFRTSFVNTGFLQPSVKGHYHLDLWEANCLVLEEAGVKKENIACSALCTACKDKLFFSHRRDGALTGRMAGWIKLC